MLQVVNRVVIESGLGGMYDVQVHDLNGDAKAEIIATTHTVSPTNGIYAYEPSGDFRLDDITWTRRTLYSNFTVFGRVNDAQRLRPAVFSVYHPEVRRGNGIGKKPLIAIATDGGGQLVVLTPNSQSRVDWNYTLSVVDQSGCDVTSPFVADVNEDGYTEVMAPCLRGSIVFVASHAPSNL